MAAPRQMTAETLNALKGWPQMAAVDFTAEFDTAVWPSGMTRVPPGSVVHLKASGKFALGLGANKRMQAMPMFTFNGSDDPDVLNDGGDAATLKGVFIPISPTGQAMALVAVGAYELVSTNFDVDAAATYVPNAPLTALGGTATTKLTDTVTFASGALVVASAIYAETVCGIVSRGVVDNGYGHDAVAFWPTYIPALGSGAQAGVSLDALD